MIRLVITVFAFLVPNLPFIVSSPGAWATGLLLPVTLPLFPSGVGVIELTHSGLVPLWPPVVYGLLEIAALTTLYIWCARMNRPLRPEIYPLLALLPFFLAWRSLLAYFLVLPVLAISAVTGAGLADLVRAVVAELHELPAEVGV